MDNLLKEHLEKNDIKYVEYAHEAVFTVEESKKIKFSVPGLHCKCLFLKSDSERFYLVAMSANKKLDIKNLRKRLGLRKMHFGSELELWNKLKLKPGSVSIFGLINNYDKDVVFVLDKEVWDAENSGFHPNINTATIVIDHSNLQRFYNSISNEKSVLEI